jgi:hypothetical protein
VGLGPDRTGLIRSLLLTIFVSVLGYVRCSTWAQSESGDREKRSNVTEKKCSNVTKKKRCNVTWNFQPGILLDPY